jgi:hypothetical protein
LRKASKSTAINTGIIYHSKFWGSDQISGLLFGWIPLKLGLRKSGFVFLSVLNGLILSWALADAFVFEQFRIHINLSMVQMTLFGGGQIVPFSLAVYLKSALLTALCFALGAFCVGLSNKLSRRSVWSAAVLCSAAWAACMIWGGFSYAMHKSAYLEASEIIPATKILHFNKLLVKHGLVSQKDIYENFTQKDSGKKNFNYPRSPLSCTGGKRPNIVFIFVDSLRYDMLRKDTMPNVSAFAKDNIVFNDHWSGGINTRHGVFTLFTGIPGSYWSKSLSTKSSSALIDALQLQKYNIGIFAGAPLTMPEFNQTIFSKIPNLRLTSPGNTNVERDESAIRDFESFVAAQKSDTPFFGFVFLNNVHSIEYPGNGKKQPFEPYLEDVDHMELNSGFDPIPYFNSYKNAVHFADKNIARMLEFLKSRGLMNDTVVVISSDHGEEFNDNGQNYWSHNGNFTKFQAKIPLVIHWPGKASQTVDYRTSALDIVPTLLPELLGCTNPTADYSSGKSLWDTTPRPFVFISNYTRNAFVEPDRINQADESGFFSMTDSANRKISGRPNPENVKAFLHETTRFYK